ncbi:MAG: HAMP domain-containing histidine kinase [Clostridiales bacterium]|nr:HAMP domain-containing histidine kinase [Clostridiales bacterium]
MNSIDKDKKPKFFVKFLNALLFIPKAIANFFKKIYAWFNYNITAKMTLINAVIFTFFGIVLIVIIVYISEKSALGPHEADLKYYYNYIANELKTGLDQDKMDSKAAEFEAAEIKIVILDGNDNFLWGTLAKTNPSFDSLINIPTDKTPVARGQNMYYAAQVIIGGQDYKIYLMRNISSDYRLLVKLKTAVYIIIPLSLIIQLIVGILSGGVLLSPIRKITNLTRKITRENLSTTRLDEGKASGELKELIQVLNGMLDNLQKSFEAQDRFVSDASHELKTPIAVLQGYSDILKRWGKEDPAVLEESINAIFKETQHMKNLVEMLLFLARADNKTANLKIENFFLNDLLEEIIKETQHTCKNRKISTGKMMAFTVDADRELIKQLIRIIIDNAIKYTKDDGEIKVSCYSDEEYAYIVVQDDGIGISKEDLSHVFERFYRADKARSRSSGTGLGLSIAKKIADAHNAEILISSEPGQGTIVNLKMSLNNEQE